jgi:endoglucanase
MIKPVDRGVRLVCLTAALLGWGCGGSGSSNGGSGGQTSGSGGTTGTGGQASPGGRTGSGGATSSSGGSTSSGGSVGTGGKVATGGVTSSSGGAVGSGGMSSMGGVGTGGSPGSGGRDAGTGGTAGMTASGGSGPGGSAAGHGGSGGSGAAGSAGSVGGAGGAVDTTAMAVAMGFGVNIGNTFDNTTTWETGWGQPLVTQAFIKGLASRGVKSVRVPVAWNTYATNGVIGSDKMNRVKEVVGWILDAGMYAMVNIHWDGGWIDSEGTSAQYTLTSDTKTKFASYWTQIATAFASVGNNLIFEGLNEEGKFYVNGDTSGTPDYAALNTLNQLFVTTVRAQGGYNPGRALLIAGFTTDITLTCVDGFTIPTDPAGAKKLFLSIHYYTPYTFCGLDTVESWGSPQTTWGTTAEQTALQNDFTKLASCSAQKKIPIIIGEFGVTKGMNYPRQSSARIMWMESVTKAAYAHGMVPMLWDTGTDISRTDGSFDTELQTVMTEAKQ